MQSIGLGLTIALATNQEATMATNRDILPFRPVPKQRTTVRKKRKPRLRTIRTAPDITPKKKSQEEVIARLLSALADLIGCPLYEINEISDDKYFYIGIRGIIAYAIVRASNQTFVAPRGVLDKNQPCGYLHE